MAKREIPEGRLNFYFDESLKVIKHDAKNAFYNRQHFNEFAGSSKAVDFIAWDPSSDGPLWLIEVKDHTGAAENTILDELIHEIPKKVRDTFAGMIACALTSNNEDEQANMESALNKRPINVVCHIELPDLAHCKLAPSPKVLMANYRNKAIRYISCAVGNEHVYFSNINIGFSNVPWRAEWK